jgi:hypothetical protein
MTRTLMINPRKTNHEWNDHESKGRYWGEWFSTIIAKEKKDEDLIRTWTERLYVGRLERENI